MKYALGNMLNGAGGLNADQLALDLQFAADKSLTARKGPTPVFTRASSGTFVGSNGLIQSAGNNVARFDHDPVTLASRGLLIEGSRTNQSLRSGTIAFGSGWFIDNATSTSSGTGPDGNTSYQITESTATGGHSLINTGGTALSAATSVTSGTVYTGSIFLKKVTGSVDWIQLTLGSGGFGTAQYANFNIGNGTVGNSAGLASGTNPRIEDYGGGWYRCSISVAATATTSTTGNVTAAFINNTNGTIRLPAYAGSTSNQVLAAMCQLEAGSHASSYIPTTTASVVRSADVCNITGAAFSGFYNQPEGTLFADVTPRTEDQRASVLCCNTSSSLNLNWIFKSSVVIANAGKRWTGQTGSVSVITTNNDVAVSQSKLAYGYKVDDYAFAYNNTIVGTDTSGGVSSPTAMRIGSRDDGLHIDGTISAIRYYRKRLPNAKLQALTA